MKMVSIWMTTYNHESFIAEAVEGVLMQQTNFDYELVIGEDCSTDKTRETVLAYKDKHPNKIRLFLPNENLGMIAMSMATFKLCDGKYVALLDGDDYWTDPLKLQKQVDFMEANRDFVLCFHKVNVLNKSNGHLQESTFPASVSPDHTFPAMHFIDMGNPIHTLSALYRNDAIDVDLPDWFSDLPFLDLGLYLLLIKNGKVKYLDEVMGVYRVHGGGAWNSESVYNNYLKTIYFWKQVITHLDYLDRARANKLIARCYLKLAELDVKAYNTHSARNYMMLVRQHDKALFLSKKLKSLKILAHIYFAAPIRYVRKIATNSDIL